MRLKILDIIIVFFITVIFYTTFASDTIRKTYFINVKGHYGVILPHAKDLRKWASTHPYGIQIDFSWLRNQEKSWEQCNCYAKAGFAFIWFNLGNPDILGHAFNTVIFYEPFLTYKRKLYLTLKAAIGPSFLTKVYNESTNPENEFFASHISYLLFMHLNFNYRITKSINFNLSACYNHISNGGQKQPNRGMNFPSLNAGIEYSINPKQFYEPINSEKINYFKEKVRYDISFYATAKNIGPSYGYPSMNVPVYGFYLSASKRLARLNGIITGFELASDGYEKELLKRKKQDTDFREAAFLLGHELIIGKIIFSQLLCLYLYNPYNLYSDKLYQRYGLRYQISKHFHTGITLKAHRHVAHIFDFRIGFDF